MTSDAPGEVRRTCTCAVPAVPEPDAPPRQADVAIFALQPRAKVFLRLVIMDKTGKVIVSKHELGVQLDRPPVVGDSVLALGVLFNVDGVLLGAGGGTWCDVSVIENINHPGFEWLKHWELVG